MTAHQLDRLHGAMSVLDSVPLARYGVDIDFSRRAADAGRAATGSRRGRRAVASIIALPPRLLAPGRR